MVLDQLLELLLRGEGDGQARGPALTKLVLAAHHQGDGPGQGGRGGGGARQEPGAGHAAGARKRPARGKVAAASERRGGGALRGLIIPARSQQVQKDLRRVQAAGREMSVYYDCEFPSPAAEGNAAHALSQLRNTPSLMRPSAKGPVAPTSLMRTEATKSVQEATPQPR